MEEKWWHAIRVFISEILGTGMLVLLGCMGCVMNHKFANNHLQICLNFGLVVMYALQICAATSGGHLNPSVTISAYIAERIPLWIIPVYFLAEMIGGILGYGILLLLVPDDAVHVMGAEHALCVTTVHPDINIVQGVAIEFLITGVLSLVYLAVFDPRNLKYHDSLTLRFGLVITSLALLGGPFTGGSMNPARSFGPAIWNLDFTDHWIYWVGPLIGSLAFGYFYKFIMWPKKAEEEPA